MVRALGLGVLLSLAASLVMIGCGPARWAEVHDRDTSVGPTGTAISYEACTSRILRVDVHAEDQDELDRSYANVLDVLQKYPVLDSMPSPSLEPNSRSLFVSLNANCEDGICAVAKGWVAFQSEVLQLSGVSIACTTGSVSPTPTPAPTPGPTDPIVPGPGDGPEQRPPLDTKG